MTISVSKLNLDEDLFGYSDVFVDLRQSDTNRIHVRIFKIPY